MTPPTLDDFVSKLMGKWSLCQGSPFAQADESGLEISPDKNWYKLYPETDGAGLRRGLGFDRQGTWEAKDNSAMNEMPSYQLNLSIFGSGTIVAHVTFSTTPRKMRIDNFGVLHGDYVIE